MVDTENGIFERRAAGQLALYSGFFFSDSGFFSSSGGS